jgi:POT family proton-dependent oligopeptide transporter
LIHGAGHFCPALFATNRTGFSVGRGLIALGSGGIKPGGAALAGDAFDQTNTPRAKGGAMRFIGSSLSALCSRRC